VTAEQAMIAELEREWPRWQFWCVYRYMGGPVFCARRWDGTGGTLNAGTPAGLTELLEAEMT